MFRWKRRAERFRSLFSLATRSLKQSRAKAANRAATIRRLLRELARLRAISENWRTAWARQSGANADAQRAKRKLRVELETAKEQNELEERTSERIDAELRGELSDVKAQLDRTKRRLREVNDVNARRITEHETLQDELAGATKERDRFCAGLNRVARALGMEGKDHFAPEAVLRKAEEVEAQLDRVTEERDGACAALADIAAAVDEYGGPILGSVARAKYAATVAARKPEPAPTLSPYEQFAAEVEDAGLVARDCGGGLWQIIGYLWLVRAWPRSAEGDVWFQRQDEDAMSGTVGQAIEAAKEIPF